MSTETEMLPPGSLVRVVVEPDDDLDWEFYRVGQEFTIEYAVPQDADDNDQGVAYYLGDSSDCFGGGARADTVQLVKTSQQMADRRRPTTAEVAGAIASASFSINEFEVVQTDTHGDGDVIELVGRTEEGLGFYASVRVQWVGSADL